MSYSYRLSLDPSCSHTGWALWEEDSFHLLVPPVGWGIVKGTSEWPGNAHTQVRSLLERIPVPKIGCAYIEMSKFMDDAGGHMSAKTDSLGKLTYVTGCLGYALWEKGMAIQLYRVDEWKGQLPKNVVWQRVVDRLGEFWSPESVEPKADAQDAIAIGLFAKGYLHADQGKGRVR